MGRRLAWVGAVFVVLGAGWMIWRNLWAIRILPATQAQVDAILDSGLRWKAPRLDAPVFELSKLHDFAKDPRAEAAAQFERDYAKKPRMLDYSVPIRSSKTVTDALLVAVSGKRLTRSWQRFGSMEPLADLKSITKLFARQVSLEIETGDIGRCFAATMSMLHWDQTVRDWQPIDELQLLVRVAAHAIVMAALEKAIAGVQFSEAQLRKIYAAIPPAEHDEYLAANALKHEFELEFIPLQKDVKDAKSVEALLSPPSLGLLAGTGDTDDSDLIAGELDWPATLNKEAELIRSAVDDCFRTWPAQTGASDTEAMRIEKTLPERPEIPAQENVLKKAWLKATYKQKLKSLPNGLGLLLISELGVSSSKSRAEANFRFRTLTEATRQLVALTLYRQKFGRLPPVIACLAGAGLKGPQPVDYFADKPFRYSPSRGTFWSVGPNAVDDGGASAANRWRGPDIVWRLK